MQRSKSLIWIGHGDSDSGEGAGVLYGIDNDVLYLVLHEDDNAFEVLLRVYRRVSFSTLLNSLEDVY